MARYVLTHSPFNSYFYRQEVLVSKCNPGSFRPSSGDCCRICTKVLVSLTLPDGVYLTKFVVQQDPVRLFY